MLVDAFVSIVCPMHGVSSLTLDGVRALGPQLRAQYRDYEIILANAGDAGPLPAEIDSLLSGVECVRYLSLGRTTSFDESIFAGLQAAIGDFVVVLPLEHHGPDVAIRLIEACRTGAHVVQGVRASRAGQSPAWRIGAWLFYRVVCPAFRIQLDPDVTYTRCLSRVAANALLSVKHKRRFLRVLSSSAGLSTTSLALTDVCDDRPRSRPRRRRLRDGVREAFEVVLTYSENPLRIAALMGVLAASANLLYILYVWLVYFFKAQVAEGWVTLSLQNAGMFFLFSIILAMLCAYVGRILQETRHRPPHQVIEEHSSPSMLARPERRNVTDATAEPVPPAESA